MSRTGTSNSDSVVPPTAPLIVVDGFLPPELALEMRRDIETHFAKPEGHRPETHQVWNYWFVPDSYTYLRTAPEKVIERARTRGQFRCALAVGEQQRTILVAHVHRPDVLRRIEPRAFFEEKAAHRELLLHGGDGKFERCVLAGNEAFRFT